MKLAASFALTAAMFAVAGCSKSSSSTADQPAASDPLQAAFAVAFPSGATLQEDGATVTYTAKQLVPVSTDVEALIAEGTQADACHACTGKLKVVYLTKAGGDLALTGKTGGWSIDGNGSGAAPNWSVDTSSPPPLLTVKASDEEQGCITSDLNVYRLGPTGVKKDKRAARHQEDAVCGGDEETDTRAAQIAGAQANWDAYFRDHPDQAPKSDDDNATSDDGDGNTTTTSTPPQ